MSFALLLTPPVVKDMSSPPLGPALLCGAAYAVARHETLHLDLNRHLLMCYLPAGPFAADSIDRALQRLHAAVDMPWYSGGSASIFDAPNPIRDCLLTHGELVASVRQYAAGAAGALVEDMLRPCVPDTPAVVGLSILHAGQVVWGAVIVQIVRRLWPGVPVIWGGPQVTALRALIQVDPAYGAFADGFVYGHAEQTWIDFLDALEYGGAWPAEVAPAGRAAPLARERLDTLPRGLDVMAPWLPMDVPRTHPVQLLRGCGYARCGFCDYTHSEGGLRRVAADVLGDALLRLRRHSGLGTPQFGVILRDALTPPSSLHLAATTLTGRVPWRASTKLHPALDLSLLTHLAASDCRGLEIGVETMMPEAQRVIGKVQSWPLLEAVLDSAAAAHVGLVLNYITGFPGVDPGDEAAWLDKFQTAVRGRAELDARVEHRRFTLKRASPMGRDPEAYGMCVVGAWPWSAMLQWEPA